MRELQIGGRAGARVCLTSANAGVHVAVVLYAIDSAVAAAVTAACLLQLQREIYFVLQHRNGETRLFVCVSCTRVTDTDACTFVPLRYVRGQSYDCDYFSIRYNMSLGYLENHIQWMRRHCHSQMWKVVEYQYTGNWWLFRSFQYFLEIL